MQDPPTPFEQFARQLEDAVLVAINRDGKRIGIERGCCCPLGVRGPLRWPQASNAAIEWGISPVDAGAFIEGFHGFARENAGEYYNVLGRAYRRKFVEAAT